MATRHIIHRLYGPVNFVCRRNLHRTTKLHRIESSTRLDFSGKDYFKGAATTVHPFTKYGGRYMVSMLPGVGIGPELMDCVIKVFDATNVPISFELLEFPYTDDEDPVAFQNALLSIRRNGVAIKGNVETKSKEVTEGSRNVKLRRSLDLFAYIMECTNIPGVKTAKKEDVNVTLIRENSEGEYLMLEHSPTPGAAESLKVVTRKAANRIARFAFDYCTFRKRRKLAVIYNSMWQTKSDQMFVAAAMNVAREYPNIKLEAKTFSRCIFELEHEPELYDVILCPNLYGVVLGSVLGGLVGGPGLLSGTNYGPQGVVFEPGARNKGTTIQGRGIANPIAMLNCAMDMLIYLGHERHAFLIYDALVYTMNEGIGTPDIGGTANTEKVIESMVQFIRRERGL